MSARIGTARRSFMVLLAIGAAVGGCTVVATPSVAASTARPAVGSVTPSFGPTAGGTRVTVTGSRFTAVTAVLFGTSRARNVRVLSNTTLSAIAPSHSAADVAVRVVTKHGESAITTKDHFTYLPKPVVTALSASAGPVRSGAVITVRGRAVLHATAVLFGTTRTTRISGRTASSLRVVAPAHRAGKVDVRVVTPGGTSAPQSKDRYVYVNPPKITSIAPADGPAAGGTLVHIGGSDFTGVVSVKFGTSPGRSIKVTSSRSLTAVAPGHAVGPVDVRVTTRYGVSAVVASDRYTFHALPAVTSLDISSGPPSGGQVISVLGSGFTGVTTAHFGSVTTSSLIVQSDSVVTVTAPSHTAGTVDVQLAGPYGTSATTPSDRFAYLQPSSPTLSWASPQTIDPVQGTAAFVSCATPTSCTAVDDSGSVAAYDTGSWSAPERVDSVATPTALSCATDSTCALVDANGYASTTVAGVWGAPTTTGLSSAVSVSCVSAAFCLAGAGDGRVTSFDGNSWSTPVVGNPDGLVAISCVSTTFCVGVGPTDASTFDGTSWTKPQQIETTLARLTAVSCASTDFCVAVDNSGMATTYNGATWSTLTAVSFTDLESVSCTSATFCMAEGGGAQVAQFNGSAWTDPLQLDQDATSSALSCASDSACLSVFDPAQFSAFDGTAWGQPAAYQNVQGNPVALSCADTADCMSVDAAGNAIAMSGSSWSAPQQIDPGQSLTAVSCADANDCMAVDATGNAVQYAAGTWQAPVVMDSEGIAAITCPSASACTAIDQDGNAVTWDGTSWSNPAPADVTGGQPVALSCWSDGHCLEFDSTGTASVFDGASWSAPISDGGELLASASCSSSTSCYATGTDGTVESFDGVRWSAPVGVDQTTITAISCSSTTACAAADAGGSGETYDGTGWSEPTAIDTGSTATALSCANTTTCVVVTASGDAITGTG